MLVESEDLFADDPEPIDRAVSLVRRTSSTGDTLIWDIVLDNANTGSGFTQDVVDIVKSKGDLNTFNRFIELTQNNLSHYKIVLTEGEIKELRKLILTLI
jgi:hypothetical protein